MPIGIGGIDVGAVGTGTFDPGTLDPFVSGFNFWKYSATPTPGRMQIDIDTAVSVFGSTASTASVWYLYNNSSTTYTYLSDKSYQIVTDTLQVYATAASFSVSPGGWNDTLSYTRGITPSNVNPGSFTQSFFHYSSPQTNIITVANVKYGANGTFSNAGTNNNRGITNFKVNELEFKIQGFSYFKMKNYELSVAETKNSIGWYYDKDLDIYHWYDKVSGSVSVANLDLAGYFPVGGNNNAKVSNKGYRLNNAIYKFVPYTYFNLTFGYQSESNSPFKIYASKTPPSTAIPSSTNYLNGIYTPPSGSVLVATITQSTAGSIIQQEFYGLKGNQYLIFVGPFMGATASGTTYSSIYLKDIQIEGAYHSGNNRQYIMTTGSSTYSTTVVGLTGATYSTVVGSGNTVNATASLSISKIYSKIGNGTFKAGIWENGVWNSGWRVDDGMYEFYNVYQFFSYNRNKRWRVQITGPELSVSKFNIGDNVSIGNIVAIDINEDRKLLKGYYTIINKTSNSIIVEFDNNFPIRRIEKDSINHRIYVTKNVWLSGGFLNGYFKGIWNYGLFKGYPLITEMYDSHWIDGIFDGGHFSTSLYTVPNFIGTFYQYDVSIDNSISVVNNEILNQSVSLSRGFLGLSFSSNHGLTVGDVVTIDKTNKLVNPQYDGEHTVLQVLDDYRIIIDVEYGSDVTSETGKITVNNSKGLLQKVEFKSNNVSKLTSSDSSDPASVFVYNSWMDVNFDKSYATNIGKPQSILNTVSRKPYSENNLYGYITNDILESTSTFRDSFSNTIRKYRLGTKYKVFSDFIGDAGKFDEDFGPTQSGFYGDGWTFSKVSTSMNTITFSRTAPIEEDGSIIGEELQVETRGSGGILDITNSTDTFITNKTYEEVQKLRYTKVEFDLITFSGEILTPLSGVPSGTSRLVTFGKQFVVPPIHFNNLNLAIKQSVTSGVLSTTVVEASYLPIYQNVNHLKTTNKKKVEYFYNKRGLGLNFYGKTPGSNVTEAPSNYVIDNLHFYEIDMIPFFQYFTENNINKSVQIPFQGISPFIDYTNVSYNFIDNLSIGLDSIRTQNSNTVISGVGVGIGGISTTGAAIYTYSDTAYSYSPSSEFVSFSP